MTEIYGMIFGPFSMTVDLSYCFLGIPPRQDAVYVRRAEDY